jgi:putative ABC transport system permease protein
MRALDRKLLRDLWQLRAQLLAIVAVVAAGVAVFLSVRGTYASLREAQADYYARQRMPDVFARVVRAPRAAARDVETIPGVAEVRARVTVDVTADVPGLDQPATLHVLSMPAPGALGGVLVRRGTPPVRADEILVNEIFAEADGLQPGAVITATIHGQRRTLRVSGVGMAPEYVMQVRPGELLPDNRRYGIAWMEDGALSGYAGMAGAFNDLVVKLAPDAREDDVLARIDERLATFGTLGAQGRMDGSFSHNFLEQKLTGLESSARMVPLIFLGVAAFLLNVVLGRLVATQRTQIGTLKAFGYSDLRIGAHFLEIVLVVVLLGAGLGAVVGVWLGGGMVELYRPYYRFPDLAFHADPRTLTAAIAVALSASVVGALGAVRRATALPPAEAMRPEPPPAFRAGAIDRPAVRRVLSVGARMAARNLLRRPVRTALSILGVALAAAIVVLTGGLGDALDLLVSRQFSDVLRSDATVLFADPRPASAVHDLAALPGVLRVEPFRMVPAALHHGHLRRQLALTGLIPGADLRRLVDGDGAVVPIPDEGMVLSRIVAVELDVAAGDVVAVELLEGSRRTRGVRVVAVVDDMVGVAATMGRDALDRLVGGPPLASGVELRLDESREAEVLTRLRGAASVASVTLRAAALQSFREQLQQNLAITQRIEVFFAVLIAFAVVYNGARTAFSERARELATLRVLGFSAAEVALVLLGELAVITLLALPVGGVLGYALGDLVMTRSASELFRLPFIVKPSSFSTAALVVLLSALASSLVVARRVGQLDLVGVLKTRD